MSTAKKRSASETGLRTRAARIVEKANLDQSTSHAAQFEVQVFARAPETFGAVILREGGNTLLIRRKKGYGSSKQIETTINRSEVIAIARDAAKDRAAAITMWNTIPVFQLKGVKVDYDAEGNLICTSAETGEVTTVQMDASARVVVTGMDGKKVAAPAGEAGAKRKAGKVTQLRRAN